MVYDRSVEMPGCDWTDKHTAQGFARRESVVNFNTPLEFGHAEVTVALGAFKASDTYERVIGVPFLVTSGTIIVDGPEEIGFERTWSLPAKNVGQIRLPSSPRAIVAGRLDIQEIHRWIEVAFDYWAGNASHDPLGQSGVALCEKMFC
jgi:Competence protein J (ComJ)